MDIDQKYPYHSIGADEAIKKLSAEKEGLSSKQAEERQEAFGKNVLPKKEGTNPIMLFLKQFKDFLIVILFIAAGIAFWADKMTDVYIILAVILFNAIMGFTQEYKAEKAIAAIKSLEQKKATVLRDGKEKEIPAEDVVPGDIIILKEGSTVPADGRILQGKELRTSEASLTGESMPVEKNTEPTEEGAPIGDRTNMVWKSTNVVNGTGRAVVTAIGNKTEIGKIAKSMGEMEMQDSNFKKKTALLGRQMAAFAIITSAIVFSLGYWLRNYEFQDILLVTIAVLVSSIPEGLPAVISIVLAIGANRMARQNVIIREFTATEMMGSVSVILVDKTGTLTQSILVIKKIFTGSGKEVAVTGTGYQLEGKFKEDETELNLEDRPVERKLLAIAAFCNDAHLKNDGTDEGYGERPDAEAHADTANSDGEKGAGQAEHAQDTAKPAAGKAGSRSDDAARDDRKEKKGEHNGNEDDDEDEEAARGPEVSGDPTEAAMFVVGKKAQIKEKEPYNRYELIDEVPFKSEQKFRASLVDTEEGPEIFAIGAPERILELSKKYLTAEGHENLDEEKRREIGEKMDEMAGQAMRVLAVGFRKAEGSDTLSADDVKDLTWVGLTGIIDPPRKGVRESVAECKTAGIRVIMVTGDHKKTAAAIAEKVGILEDRKEEKKEEEEKNEYPSAMTTKELDVEDNKFDDYLRHVNVFARMNPDTKLRIAERLQAKDTLVAMTGDGVNDAPALKRADVGISMGKRGTDVAKDASEIVLQDDNFSSIVNAIREGRIVFNNVKITSYFLLTTNFAFAIAFILGMSIGWPLLFTAAQILYVNLITDGIMDIALATEPGHGDIMEEPPVRKSEKILKWDVVPYLIVVSAVMVTLTMFTFQYYLPQGEVMARTGAFIVVSTTQLFNAYNMRSLKLSLFDIGPFKNMWVNIAFLTAIVLQFLVVKVPAVSDLMGFESLSVLEFLVLVAISASIILVGELYKFLKFKKKLF